MNKNIALLAPAGFIVLGVIFITISLCMRAARRKTKELCTVPVPAVITAVVEESSYSSMDHSRSRSWFPVYEYTYNGEQYKIRSHIGGMQSDYEIGSESILMVNPEKSMQFYNADDGFNTIVKVFLFSGICMCSFGIAAVLIFWKIFGNK